MTNQFLQSDTRRPPAFCDVDILLDQGKLMKLHAFILLVAFGTVLAIMYSRSLWWTVNRLAAAKRPALLILTSYWLRMVVLALCFYLAMDHSWDRLAATLAGFFVTRTLLVRRAKEQSALAAMVQKR
jgi:F1F0 ATPase subunit 2